MWLPCCRCHSERKYDSHHTGNVESSEDIRTNSTVNMIARPLPFVGYAIEQKAFSEFLGGSGQIALQKSLVQIRRF